MGVSHHHAILISPGERDLMTKKARDLLEKAAEASEIANLLMQLEKALTGNAGSGIDVLDDDCQMLLTSILRTPGHQWKKHLTDIALRDNRNSLIHDPDEFLDDAVLLQAFFDKLLQTSNDADMIYRMVAPVIDKDRERAARRAAAAVERAEGQGQAHVVEEVSAPSVWKISENQTMSTADKDVYKMREMKNYFYNVAEELRAPEKEYERFAKKGYSRAAAKEGIKWDKRTGIFKIKTSRDMRAYTRRVYRNERNMHLVIFDKEADHEGIKRLDNRALERMDV